jgi:hypothetical protein
MAGDTAVIAPQTDCPPQIPFMDFGVVLYGQIIFCLYKIKQQTLFLTGKDRRFSRVLSLQDWNSALYGKPVQRLRHCLGLNDAGYLPAG